MERERFVADGEAFLKAHLAAKAAAIWARAFGMVMRKGARADGLVSLAAIFAGEV